MGTISDFVGDLFISNKDIYLFLVFVCFRFLLKPLLADMTGLQSRKRLGMNLKCFFLIHVLIIYNHWFVGIKFSVGWIFLAALLYHETLAEFHNVPFMASCSKV